MTTNESTAVSLRDMRLCFYGAGSMAEAIIQGLTERGLIAPERIGVMNRSNGGRLAELAERYGVSPLHDTGERLAWLREADIVFLAMKPKDAEAALAALRGVVTERQLLVSVIAGLPIATIGRLVGENVPVVRTMPNTSSTIGLGATGVSYSPNVPAEGRAVAETIFGAVGMTAVVDEPLLDAVTGVSGSGPAYVYYLMEAMIDAAGRLGLAPETARELTVQTVLGAAQMMRTTGGDPAELRRKVTSPGGTTEAAIAVLDESGFPDAVRRAVARAAERAGELGAIMERSASK